MTPRPPEPDARQSDRGYDEATREGEPYENEVYGDVIEVRAGETVDGDLNGAPELAALHESGEREAPDALDGLQGSDAEERRVQSVEPLAARFRSALELRRDEVLERIDESRPGLTEHEGGASSGRGDPADAPDEIETAAALEDQIARIDRALERLENGEYGRCLECGERIRLRLLDDEPARELCEACEELL